MGSLRISFPISEESRERFNILLNIESATVWQTTLQHLLCDSAEPSAQSEAEPDADKDGWANDPCSEDKPLDLTPLTLGEVLLLRPKRPDSTALVNEEDDTTEERIKTYEILTGKRNPPPDRHYTGANASVYFMYAREEMRAKETWDLRQTSEEAMPEAVDNPCGWASLRGILEAHMSTSEAARLVPHDPKQIAYLLTMNTTPSGALVAKKEILNLCTRTRLRRLMERVEQRGWQDIIWVTYNHDIPELLETGEFDGAREICWVPKRRPRPRKVRFPVVVRPKK